MILGVYLVQALLLRNENFDIKKPFNDLPLLPPKQELETN
jgi:hypothetical protein